MKKEAQEKCHVMSFPSAFSRVIVCTTGESVSKSMHFRIENELVWIIKAVKMDATF